MHQLDFWTLENSDFLWNIKENILNMTLNMEMTLKQIKWKTTYSEPFVVQHFLYGNPVIYIRCKHSLYEILGWLADIVP